MLLLYNNARVSCAENKYWRQRTNDIGDEAIKGEREKIKSKTDREDGRRKIETNAWSVWQKMFLFHFLLHVWDLSDLIE